MEEKWSAYRFGSSSAKGALYGSTGWVTIPGAAAPLPRSVESAGAHVQHKFHRALQGRKAGAMATAVPSPSGGEWLDALELKRCADA